MINRIFKIHNRLVTFIATSISLFHYENSTVEVFRDPSLKKHSCVIHKKHSKQYPVYNLVPDKNFFRLVGITISQEMI